MKTKKIDEALVALGVDPASIPDVGTPGIQGATHDDPDPFRWTGTTFDALRDEFEFYRASACREGESVEAAEREGYRRLPADADAKMAGCHGPNDVIMIRRRTVGDAIRQAEARERDRSHAAEAQAVGGVPGIRHDYRRQQVVHAPEE